MVNEESAFVLFGTEEFNHQTLAQRQIQVDVAGRADIGWGAGDFELDRLARLMRDGQLFFQKLLLEQAGVVAIAIEKFLVGAQLRDLAADQDCDAVGVAHG